MKALPDQFFPALMSSGAKAACRSTRLVKTYELSEINQAAHHSESGKVVKTAASHAVLSPRQRRRYAGRASGASFVSATSSSLMDHVSQKVS